MSGSVLVLVFYLCLSCASALAQQDTTTLLFINGTQLQVFELNDSDYTVVKYRYDANYFKRQRLLYDAQHVLNSDSTRAHELKVKARELPSRWKMGSAAREELFSARSSGGPEKLYYYPDDDVGSELSVPQMKAFVYGGRDARKGSSDRWWLYGGIAVGAAAGYLLEGSVFTLAVPPLLALSARIPVVQIREVHISDRSYYGNEDYAAGYEAHTRGRNTIAALKGGAIGAAVGLLTYFAQAPNR